MTRPGWAVRFYDRTDYYKTVGDIVSNFQNFGDRQEDDVVVFSGLYGIDSYLMWYMHKNLGEYDFSTVDLEVKLFLDGNSRSAFYKNQYKIESVKYDANESRYVLYAVSIDTAKLQVKLKNTLMGSLKWDESRGPWETLYDVLEKNNIFKIFYMPCEYENELPNLQYRTLSINHDWRVIDFINYICDENELEWFVRGGVLYIGSELNAIKAMNSSRMFDIETDNYSESSTFVKYKGVTRPMDVLSHMNNSLRCVWVKHAVGKCGGLTAGCFTKIGSGSMNKMSFFRTLEGKTEKALGTKLLLSHNSPSHYVTIGNIMKDLGDERFIDEVSVQKNIKNSSVINPNDVKIDTGDDSSIPVINIKEKISRSTQYLDEEAGLFFPRNNQDEIPPNSLIFNVEGKEQAPVVGPFVMGNGNPDFKIPFKEPEDFRLRFPDGAEIYYDASAMLWFIQSSRGLVFKQAITEYDGEPVKSRLTEEESMLQIYQGNILFDTEIQHAHFLDGGCFQVVPKSSPDGTGNRRFSIYCDNEYGRAWVTALNEIKIAIEDGLNNPSGGTITISTSAAGTIELVVGTTKATLTSTGLDIT